MIGVEIPFEEAERLILKHSIVEIAAQHPACLDFRLGNGDILAYYPGDRDYPDTWKVEAQT